MLLLFYFTFYKTYYPFQYHFSLLYFNILLFPFMDTNDLTCTCVFDFIAFTCRLNWMNYAFKFPFSYTLLPSHPHPHPHAFTLTPSPSLSHFINTHLPSITHNFPSIPSPSASSSHPVIKNKNQTHFNTAQCTL